MGLYVKKIWGWNEQDQRSRHNEDWQEKRPQVILYDNKPIGCILIDNEADHIYVGRFYILPKYQSKGIGTHVLKGIFDQADKANKPTTLAVLKINPALTLYKRLGFRVTGANEFQYLMERKPGEQTEYKAVIFDLFGTLVDIFSLREYESVLEKMAIHLKAPYASFHNVWMQTAKLRTTGVLPTLEENLEHICNELKISASNRQIQAACRVRCNYVKRALKPRKDAIETLSKLKAAGYKIGLISNCSSEPPLIWPGTRFARFFDVAIFSSVARLLKPDPKIFHLALEKLQVTPARCLYIGDGGDKELTAAAGVGMTPVLIRASHEDASDALRPNDDVIENFTGPKITSLKEVLNLVK